MLGLKQFKVITVLVKTIECNASLNLGCDLVETLAHSLSGNSKLRVFVVKFIIPGFLFDLIFHDFLALYFVQAISMVDWLHYLILINLFQFMNLLEIFKVLLELFLTNLIECFQ